MRTWGMMNERLASLGGGHKIEAPTSPAAGNAPQTDGGKQRHDQLHDGLLGTRFVLPFEWHFYQPNYCLSNSPRLSNERAAAR